MKFLYNKIRIESLWAGCGGSGLKITGQNVT